jgi:circadian clock protein KaiB
MIKFKIPYGLKLYVAGNTTNCVRAFKILKNILEDKFKGVYAFKVIDILKNINYLRKIKFYKPPL